MKPTQEQILSALNKLIRENKTELKTEKVELALVDDLKDLIKRGKELGVDYKSIKEYKDLDFNLDAALTFSKQATEVSKKIRKYLK